MYNYIYIYITIGVIDKRCKTNNLELGLFFYVGFEGCCLAATALMLRHQRHQWETKKRIQQQWKKKNNTTSY